MAVLFVVCYMFVKSFPDRDGHQPASPLIRIAVVSLGPIVWNAAVLLIQFMFSLFLGPFLDTKYPKFGSAMAFVAHSLGVIGMIAFFEFLVSVSDYVPAYDMLMMPAVVLGVVERVTRRSGSHCRYLHPARHPQGSHRCLPVS